MQRSEYQDVFAISQSAIKCFKTKTLAEFKHIYIDKLDSDEDDSKFAFGSLVDTLAFQPELMEKRFFIADEDVQIPGEKVKLIIDKVFKEALQIIENKTLLNEQGNLPEPLYIPDITSLGEFETLILKYAKEIKYGGTTWSSGRIFDSVFSDGSSYFTMLGKCGNRHVIKPFDNADAIEMVEALRKDKETASYFVQQENETLLFQQEFFLEYAKDGVFQVPLKCAFDIIRLNHNNKTARNPDLKTTHNNAEISYKGIVKSFDYLTQVSFYNFMLKEFLKVYEDGKYKDYEILPPINIAIDRKLKVPYIYEYDFEDIAISEHGSQEFNYKGWRQYLDEIVWHISSGVWDRPKEIYEKGKIKIKIFTK